jgi:hypothetical protein
MDDALQAMAVSGQWHAPIDPINAEGIFASGRGFAFTAAWRDMIVSERY